jgi:branched-chain amino acid transport system permease protein
MKNNIFFISLLILLAALPLFNVNEYILHISILTFLYIVLSSSWNILGGLAGQVSFGFSVFWGMGAYTLALALKGGLSLIVGILIAVAVSAVLSIIIGYPTLRLRGPYFAIASIGVGEAVRVFMLVFAPGGASGLTVFDPTAFAKEVHYYSAFALLVVVLFTVRWIMRSKFGLGLASIKENEDAAISLGVNTIWLKVTAHLIAAVFISIAGALYARYQMFIEPNGVFSFQQGISILMMPVIGGLGTFWGPILGAVVFVVVQDQLLASYPELNMLFYGILLVLIILFEGGGVVGFGKRSGKKISRGYSKYVGKPAIVNSADK